MKILNNFYSLTISSFYLVIDTFYKNFSNVVDVCQLFNNCHSIKLLLLRFDQYNNKLFELLQQSCLCSAFELKETS